MSRFDFLRSGGGEDSRKFLNHAHPWSEHQNIA
jgi:hypothetical protein